MVRLIGGDALRTYLATPDLSLRLIPLPGYSPDYDADEAIWDWIREEVSQLSTVCCRFRTGVAADYLVSRNAT